MNIFCDEKNLDYSQMQERALRWLAELGSPRIIVLLDGPLGAGKTQWVKWILEEAGSDEAASPSFALHLQYDTDFGMIHHLDLYRIRNEEELEFMGIWDIFSREEGLVFIEWPDILGVSNLPRQWERWRVRITPSADPQRRDLLIQKEL